MFRRGFHFSVPQRFCETVGELVNSALTWETQNLSEHLLKTITLVNFNLPKGFRLVCIIQEYTQSTIFLHKLKFVFCALVNYNPNFSSSRQKNEHLVKCLVQNCFEACQTVLSKWTEAFCPFCLSLSLLFLSPTFYFIAPSCV